MRDEPSFDTDSIATKRKKKMEFLLQKPLPVATISITNRGTPPITGQPPEDIEMINIDSWQEPVFLDGDDEFPQELPLMVTRHTLRSMSLSKDLLEELGIGSTSDDKMGASKQANISPRVQVAPR